MHDAAAIGRAAHDVLVDMIGREIARDTGKPIDVRLADRLVKLRYFTYCDMKCHYLTLLMQGM
jgi:hypothetical protein